MSYSYSKTWKYDRLKTFYGDTVWKRRDYDSYMQVSGWKRRVAEKTARIRAQHAQISKTLSSVPPMPGSTTHTVHCSCSKCGTNTNFAAIYKTWWAATATTTTTLVADNWSTDGIWEVQDDRHVYLPIGNDDAVELPKRREVYRLPDGTLIRVDGQGNFQLDDANAQVIYRANRNREFNPYLNASDLLARFVKYVGSLGIPAQDILTIPTSLFVQWLVLEAAQHDGDTPPPDVRPLPESRLLKSRLRPQCQLPTCRRFLPRERAGRYPYCSPDHGAAHGALLLAG